MVFRLALAGVFAALAVLAPASAQGPRERRGYDAPPEAPGLILFSHRGFGGELREIYDGFDTLGEIGFNDRARALSVVAGVWELCEHRDFTGRCAVVRRDVYDLDEIGLAGRVTSVRPVYEYTDAPHGFLFERGYDGRIEYADAYLRGHDDGYYDQGRSVSTRVYVFYGHTPGYHHRRYYHPRFGHGPYGWRFGPRYGRPPAHGYARGNPYPRGHHVRRDPPPLKGHYGARNGAVTIYTDSRGRGASFGLNRAVPDLSRWRFNDNVSSIEIREGQWELCEHANYQGRCRIVDASVERLNDLRLNDNVSSIRPVGSGANDGAGGRGQGGGAGRDRGRGGGDHAGRGHGGGHRGGGQLLGGSDTDRARGGRGRRDGEDAFAVRRNQPAVTPRRAVDMSSARMRSAPPVRGAGVRQPRPQPPRSRPAAPPPRAVAQPAPRPPAARAPPAPRPAARRAPTPRPVARAPVSKRDSNEVRREEP